MKKHFISVLIVGLLTASAHAKAQHLAPATQATSLNAASISADADEQGASVPDRLSIPNRVSDLLFQAMSLIGVNYKYGGSSIERGFDCSGFVHYVFAQSLSVALPRNSLEMSKLGKPVDIGELQPGDLVFFNTRKRKFSHVAIYVGDSRFVHAPSKGKQVELVDMKDRYWQQRYNGARRIGDIGEASQ